MSLKFKDEVDYASFNNLMEEDGTVVYELSCLVSNIKKLFRFWIFFVFFFKKYEERNAHNMLSLMLDPKLKTFHLLSSLISCERSKVIVEKCDKKSLFPMLFKCYYHLHSLVGSERGVVHQRIEKDKNLDIFEMIPNISEPTTKLVNRELLIFRRYQVDVKNVKCLQGWEKDENMFLTFCFCPK
jgi:hypothetical protein